MLKYDTNTQTFCTASAGVMSTRKVSQCGLDDWQAVLDSNYHHLCRSVRPEAFFSWLRSKRVFTCEDQEEIENKYMTTVMKSGNFLNALFHDC